MTTRRARCAFALALTPLAGAHAQVGIRGQAEPLNAQVVAVGREGLTVREPGATATLIVGWDQVKSLPASWSTQAAPFLIVGENLWRARARVERADLGAAEPIFESLESELTASRGPTAAVCAEGLLRCRLARGATAAGVGVWLKWSELVPRSGAPKEWLGGRIAGTLAPVRDDATGLIPELPPVWLNDTGLAAVVSGENWVRAAIADAEASEYAALYLRAARFELGLPVEAVRSTPVSESPGVKLVREIVMARTGTPDERVHARTALERRLVNPPERWQEAWIRTGLGRSWLRETDPASRRRGVLELLHLPARFGSEQWYLTGIALAESAAAMSDAGDLAAQEILIQELRTRFSDHPAIGWLASRIVPPAPIDPASAPAPGKGAP